MSLDDKLIVEPALTTIKKKKWYGTWSANCDMCNSPLRKFESFYDARLRYRTAWALMCPSCFDNFGVVIGIGYGQKYDSKTLEKIGG